MNSIMNNVSNAPEITQQCVSNHEMLSRRAMIRTISVATLACAIGYANATNIPHTSLVLALSDTPLPDATPRILLMGAGSITVPNIASTEVTLARKTISGGMLQPGDFVEIVAMTSCNNSSPKKTIRFYFGGRLFFENAPTTNTTSVLRFGFFVRSSDAIVTGNIYGGPSFGNAYAGSRIAVIDVNTTLDGTLDIRGMKESASDTLVLEGFKMLIYRGSVQNEAEAPV